MRYNVVGAPEGSSAALAPEEDSAARRTRQLQTNTFGTSTHPLSSGATSPPMRTGLYSLVGVAYADHEIEVNYDIGHYKLLQINQTLELICKNMLNRDPPSW
ncbi:hypothetical protein B566_EDAN013994 [Ephemera danica]|nr:hypothetical protein B566_EDAN013994 [Ephemera danica]